MSKKRLGFFTLILLAGIINCADATSVAAGSNTTSPSVQTSTPSAGSTDISTGTTISITFAESMDSSTLNASNFYIVTGNDCNTNIVSGSISQSGNTYSFSPNTAPSGGQEYTTCVKAAVKNSAGVSMAGNYVATWTTLISGPTVPGQGK